MSQDLKDKLQEAVNRISGAGLSVLIGSEEQNGTEQQAIFTPPPLTVAVTNASRKILSYEMDGESLQTIAGMGREFRKILDQELDAMNIDKRLLGDKKVADTVIAMTREAAKVNAELSDEEKPEIKQMLANMLTTTKSFSGTWHGR